MLHKHEPLSVVLCSFPAVKFLDRPLHGRLAKVLCCSSSLAGFGFMLLVYVLALADRRHSARRTSASRCATRSKRRVRCSANFRASNIRRCGCSNAQRRQGSQARTGYGCGRRRSAIGRRSQGPDHRLAQFRARSSALIFSQSSLAAERGLPACCWRDGGAIDLAIAQAARSLLDRQRPARAQPRKARPAHRLARSPLRART